VSWNFNCRKRTWSDVNFTELISTREKLGNKMATAEKKKRMTIATGLESGVECKKGVEPKG
jgi:hypothetical protein